MNIFVLSGKMMKFNIIEIAELIFDNLNNKLHFKQDHSLLSCNTFPFFPRWDMSDMGLFACWDMSDLENIAANGSGGSRYSSDRWASGSIAVRP